MISTGDFPVLITGRLILRELLTSDAAAIFSVFSDSIVTEYYGLETFHTLHDAEQFLSALDDGYMQGKSIRWGIELAETGDLIGTIGFHNWSHVHNRTEIGYELNRAYWGNGYMSEAMRCILAFGFSNIGFHRIGATIRPENKESIALVERFGFIQDGLLQDYQRTSKGYFPLYMYSLLRPDFT
ncbi:GNAT family N-acetyltransferase [Fictibacillus iocasae]|uniref:GNAT family N-acetyltransferase n=1 Tax=Fictibacillus iocasae TaxID=2715437 RepID=A0ABW2NRG6_9BACL